MNFDVELERAFQEDYRSPMFNDSKLIDPESLPLFTDKGNGYCDDCGVSFASDDVENDGFHTVGTAPDEVRICPECYKKELAKHAKKAKAEEFEPMRKAG